MTVTIGSAIVLILIIVGIFCYYKFCVPKDSDKDAAMEFLNGFVTVFGEIIETIIDEIDITKYTSLDLLETDIFKIAYEKCWDYVESALQTAMENNSITKLISKCITQETVEATVTEIINSSMIASIEAKYIANWEDSTAESEAEDAELAREADLYESEEKEVDEYVEPEITEPEEEINPPTDEEGPYVATDESQEILSGEDAEIGYTDMTEAIEDSYNEDNVEE